MKRLFSLLIVVAFLSSCSKSEDYYATYYLYKNATDTPITVSSYSPSYIEGAWSGGKNSIFVIESNEEYTTFFEGIGGFNEPLHWDLLPPGGGDSTIVSNGSKKLVQYYKDPNNSYSTDNLYLKEKYEVVSSKKREQIYRYTFTNKDFE